MAYTIFTINDTAWVFSPQKFSSSTVTGVNLAAPLVTAFVIKSAAALGVIAIPS